MLTISYNRLPAALLNPRALRRRYNAGRVQRMLWQVEQWWRAQTRSVWRQAIAEARRTLVMPSVPWPHIANVAMQAIVRIGGWSADRLVTMRKAFPRRRPGRVHVRKQAGDSAEGASVGPVIVGAESGMILAPEPGEVNWAMLEGETWEQFKERINTPLYQTTYSVPVEACDRYAAEHIPAIKDASEQLRTRVRDIITQAQQQGLAQEEVEALLQEAGDWSLHRVRNQIATETANLYVGGQLYRYARDEEIVGFRYLVTIDEATTPICQEFEGVSVRAEDLRAAPPMHFFCRTELDPVFSWERPEWSRKEDVPHPGEGEFTQWAGFGQPDRIEEFHATRRALPAAA